MHSKIVIRNEDKTPRAPRVIGSGYHLIVLLVVLLPNIENIVRDIEALPIQGKGFNLRVSKGISMRSRKT
jgi:hypothetical protein